jgi:hypothetical protein
MLVRIQTNHCVFLCSLIKMTSFSLYVDTNVCGKPVAADILGSLIYPRNPVILILVCYFGKKIN